MPDAGSKPISSLEVPDGRPAAARTRPAPAGLDDDRRAVHGIAESSASRGGRASAEGPLLPADRDRTSHAGRDLRTPGSGSLVSVPTSPPPPMMTTSLRVAVPRRSARHRKGATQ